jgi:hypothetical protein
MTSIHIYYDVTTTNEFMLSIIFKKALSQENYELCSMIQKEINDRIENDSINHSFMDGFRRYDRENEEFYGDYNFEGLNGLFDKYLEKYARFKN